MDENGYLKGVLLQTAIFKLFYPRISGYNFHLKIEKFI